MKTVLSFFIMLTAAAVVSAQTRIYVSPVGCDQADGTPDRPFATLGRALDAVPGASGTDVGIVLRAGSYNLSETETITSARTGGKMLTIQAAPGEEVTLGSFRTLDLKWKKDRKGLWSAPCIVPVDRFFLGGEERILARYPNYTEGELFGGTSEDALSKDRIRKWKNPEGGIINTLHYGMWGSQHYRILGKQKDSLVIEGGHQVTRPSAIHPKFRFVENIREELDAPGEWYWSKEEQVLYYMPLPGENPQELAASTTSLFRLIDVQGTADNPFKGLAIKGITFTGTGRTFMEPYEVLMRSDWGIYRGGALTLTNTEDCLVEGCEFTGLGGNALFISRYARHDRIASNHIHHIGGSAICLVGDTSAVRSGSYGYEDFVRYEEMDLVPGPKNGLYPRECVVEDNLIHDLGFPEKQVAGVEIQIAALLEIRHNSIYDIPRAGINIGDGAFGGHVIEYNDVFNTVLETSDHGAFNSWGRDRWWLPSYEDMAVQAAAHPELILSDALYTTVIRYNRFRCDHGWDIDLDDGSSNYHIYGNLCLSGGIKLREGFFRRVENNVTVNNSFHPHVWFKQSHDIVRRNVFCRQYFPIGLNGWGDEVDFNFIATPEGLEKARANGTDSHSVTGNVSFADPLAGNYTLLPGSAAFETGFENIPMSGFGVTDPRLRAVAKTPVFPDVHIVDVKDQTRTYVWEGVTVRSISGMGDRSAHGLPDEDGVLLVEVPADSRVAAAGLCEGDVLRSADGQQLEDVSDLFSCTERCRWLGHMSLSYFRNQKENTASLAF